MIILSSLSCLSVVSFAANVLESGYTPDSVGTENQVVAWEFYDDGVLYIYDDTGNISWADFSEALVKVVVKPKSEDVNCGAIQIPEYAFYGCDKLATVDLSGGVSSLQYIGKYAFSGCSALTEIVLPYGITDIGEYAFYGCSALKNATLSVMLEEIGKNVFKGCTALETVEVPLGVKAIGYGMFEDCSALTTIALPDSVEIIEAHAFEDCVSLSEINVPDSVKEIGAYAYKNCGAVTKAYIGHNAQTIGEYAFNGCAGLTSVEIASAVKEFSEGMFMGCKNLSTIAVAEGVEIIGKNAFKGCSALASITFPTSLKTIKDSAFDGTALSNVYIPADVNLIEKGVFTNCANLTAIDVDAKNDNYIDIDGVLYAVETNTLMLCPAGKTGEIEVKAGTAAITEDAFIGCVNVTVVSIPDSVQEIAPNAFNDCSDDLVIKGNCDSFGIKFANSNAIEIDAIHTASDVWEETVAPTCLADGSKQRVCSGCGFVYETVAIPKLGHSFDDGVITTKATCDADGVMTFTCTRTDCSESYTEVIPATKHNYDTGKVISAATCDTDGTMRYSCQNAGCLSYYDEVIDKTGHNMDAGTITKPVTCVEDGEKVYKCQNAGCLHKVTEVIEKTGHNYDDGVVTTPATCTEKGVMTYTCQNANCADSYTEDIDATGHNYIATEIKKATCVEDGKIQHVCANCGDSYVENTKGEHMLYSTPVKVNPTCTEAGKEGNKCAICNQFVGEVTEIPATGHKYENGVCSGCGASGGAQKPTTPGGTVVTPEGSTGTGSVAKAPATPKLLLLVNRNEGLVLTWKEVEGAKGYRVYRRAAGAKSWTYLATIEDCTYVDKTATTGEYWRYTVRATNDAGFSGFENGIYIKRVATPHLTSIANAANGVKVTWNAVSNAKSYKVYRRGAGETWKCIATVKGTSYVDTAIKANSGNYYRYTVRAIDGYYSAYETGLVTKYVAAPHLTGIANTSNGIKVNWDAVNGADSYRVYRRAAGQSWVYVTTVTGTSYVDTAATASGYYRYTVRAVDGSLSAYEAGLVIKK